ncbi:MAG: ribosome silencing factor [Flavobacteriales bacterium]|jgi:ribosome-associated protein|nr:ribosome silencing factor [Flavobacteriales bacterium]NCG29085.1 ribosome silencing factor [Bacteroidota bacterium]MBT3963843.1 ribosome silencing factor [Flavobacteriales bacterium]MBT4704949.1 ribosome silencing factor [Flavobacteriales bacterium]MBT4929724.1 ribosome silencing factor [Flavobacteriales bacterium]
MTNKNLRPSSEELADCVIEGMKGKKGLNIVKMDLRETGSALTDFFILCHGTSDRQVDAIADSIVNQVRTSLNDKPSLVEGRSNAEWILLDYVDVIVHVFQQEVRDDFALEELWADATIEHIGE